MRITQGDNELIVRTVLNHVSNVPVYYVSHKKYALSIIENFSELILDLYSETDDVLKSELNNSHALFFDEFSIICQKHRFRRVNNIIGYNNLICAVLETKKGIEQYLVWNAISVAHPEMEQIKQIKGFLDDFWKSNSEISFEDILKINSKIA